LKKHRLGIESAFGNEDHFPFLDQNRAFFAGGFGLTAQDGKFGPAIFLDVDPVKTCIKDVERSIGGMDLKILFPIQRPDTEKNAPIQNMELGRVIIPIRESDDINLGVEIETEVVSSTELNFGPSFPRAKLVSGNDDEVHLALFVAEVLGSLDIDVPLDITQTVVTPVVIPLGLSRNQNRKCHNRRDRQS